MLPARFGEDYYGLGFPLGGHPVAFSWHGGGTAGFYAYFVGYTDTGQGAAILANGKTSGELIQIVIHSIAKEYGGSHGREQGNPNPGATQQK